jgi:hypothetical protein
MVIMLVDTNKHYMTSHSFSFYTDNGSAEVTIKNEQSEDLIEKIMLEKYLTDKYVGYNSDKAMPIRAAADGTVINSIPADESMLYCYNSKCSNMPCIRAEYKVPYTNIHGNDSVLLGMIRL